MRRASTAAIAVAVCAAGVFAYRMASPARPPNVVVLVMDTTRADRCSFNGYARPTTPSVDAFAQDAVVYRNAWSPAGWTGPAHASLFTGLRCENHGFYPGNSLRLREGPLVLAESLRSAGYATGCFANNAWFDSGYGLTRGFDHVDERFRDDARPYPWAAATHAAAADWAKARAAEGKPFFLFVNDMEPHLTYAPPQDVAARFVPPDARPEDVAAMRMFDYPATVAYCARAKGRGIAPERLALLSDLYDAEIATLDREIGAFLGRLRDDGLLDDAVVVIVGDHGEMLGEQHQTAHGFSLHRPVRHVPLVVRAKGVLDGGRTVDDLVRLEDLFPTIAEICGARVPKGIDGVSLLRDLGGRLSFAVQADDPETARRLEEAVPGASAGALTTRVEAVFDGRWHYLAYGDGRRELFDVSADPSETKNVVEAEPAHAARLAALLSR